jgi:hypothetical protein
VVVTARSFLQGNFFDALHPGHQHVKDFLCCLIVARAIGIELCFPVAVVSTARPVFAAAKRYAWRMTARRAANSMVMALLIGPA